MSMTTFIVFMDGTVVNTALPSIARGFAASNATLQWVVNTFSLLLAGLLLVGGTTGDRFGRRKVLALGALLFGAAAAGAALSPNATTLIVMRGLQGVGAAFMLPSTLSIITNVFDRQERVKAIVIWSMAVALSAIVGPAIGGLIVDNIGWKSIFWLHLPFVAAILLGLRFVPESRDSRQLSLDIPGAVLVTGGLLLVIFGVIQGGESGWTSARIVGAFALGGALLLLFGIVEARSAQPMLPLRYLRQRDVIGPFLVMTAVMLAIAGAMFFLTQFFQLVQGRSALTAGLFLTPAALGMMVTAGIATKAGPAVGPKILTVLGCLGVMGGFALLTQIEVGSSFAVPALGLTLFGLGVGFVMPSVTDTIMAAIPVDESGIASALNDTSREFGFTLGVAILGAIVSSVYRNGVVTSLGELDASAFAATVGDSFASLAKITEGLPLELANSVTLAANESFLNAMDRALVVAIAFIGLSAIIALFTVPAKMRLAQAEIEG